MTPCRARLLAPFVALALLAACSGDDSSTPASDSDTTEAGPTDVTGTETTPVDSTETAPVDSTETTPVDSTESSEPQPSLNACGGEGELRHLGVVAAPLGACGAFEEGVLVCNGTDSLRCVGESPVNACGGEGVLPVELGTTCGPCGEGTWVCGGSGVQCVGDGAVNACGGCTALDASPGESCTDGDAPGLWICEGTGTLTCLADAVNACGGTDALQHQGADALPGEACDLACGQGILTCDGTDALSCAATAETEPENACGGCGPLPGTPDADCGFCGNGQWTCNEDGTMACAGADAPNACGGCDAVPGTPGEACGDEARWLCEGTALTCTPRASGLLNACGGTEDLDATPGEACGTCGGGVSFCASFDAVACSVPDDQQENACGGCAVLTGRAGDACGECGDGSLACAGDGESLTCEGAEQVRNACGGCGVALENEPGTACGDCGTWQCASSMTVRCRGEADLQTDAENCGFCNNACLEGDICVAGECANACGGESELDGTPGDECGSCGTWACDGQEAVVCEGDADLQTDAENCGSCGNACDGESGCLDGECVPPNACGGFSTLPAERGSTCEECGTWVCNGEDDLRCSGGADLQSDPLNCGACGEGCMDGELCMEGVCEVDRVVQLAAGQSFTCALTESGHVTCWGQAGAQLGGSGLSGIEAISAGRDHACAILSTGRAMCWGWNGNGQLGIGETGGHVAEPALVEGLQDISFINPGLNHTCALVGGEAWCWGRGDSGQLGDGLEEDSPLPVRVGGELPSPVTDVAAGRDWSCAVAGGEVWCWGRNSPGGLGDGVSVSSALPVRVTGLPSARDVVVAEDHACALTTGNQIHCWGSDTSGALGNGGGGNSNTAVPVAPFGLVDRIAAPSQGQRTCAIRQDGQLYCWGNNSAGVLGLGDRSNRNTPQPVPGLNNIVDVDVSRFHVCVVRATGEVLCMGRNHDGEIGDGQSAVRRWERWTPTRNIFIPPVTSEYGTCFTGFDNSGNGLADCDDPDCAADLGSALGEEVATGQLLGFEGNYTLGSCGGATGPEAVFRWTAPADGSYRFALGNESSTQSVLYVRENGCLGQELACETGEDASFTLSVEEGQELIVIVDSNPPSTNLNRSGAYTLGITAVD